MAEIDKEDFDTLIAKEAAGVIDPARPLGFGDQSGVYPRPEYFYRSSINTNALGGGSPALSVGGGDPRVEGFEKYLSGATEVTPQYTNVDVRETKSGHILIFDDTPGGEKVLIKHRSGAGVELRADGTMILKTEANMITAVNGNSAVIIEGDVQLSAKNLTFDIAADMKLNVGGNMTVNVEGDLIENIQGARRDVIGGNKGTTVKGNTSMTTVGTSTTTTLGSYNNIVKGSFSNIAEGTSSIASKGNASFTSEGEANMSSPNINIAASSLSVFGATGTIGGEGVVGYVKNIFGTSGTFTAGVTAPTFHGALNGNANTATQAGRAGTAGSLGASGSAGTVVNTPTDTTATAKPTASLLNSYLNKSNRGVPKISIDKGDFIKNSLLIGTKTGGVTNKSLSVSETRARMRDENNATNQDFVAHSISTGKLSPSHISSVPPAVGRHRSLQSSAKTPSTFVPGSTGQATDKTFVAASKPPISNFTPNPVYDPQRLDPRSDVNAISASYVLGNNGITVGTFLGGTGSKTTLSHINTFAERQSLARQLTLQTQVLEFVQNDKSIFKDYRLVVVEGVYKPETTETLSPGSLKDLATTGRVIVYQLVDQFGKQSTDKMYDLADFMADAIMFDRLILDYDTYDPSGKLSAHLIVEMPEISSTYSVVGGYFKNKLETRFNNKVQSNTDIIEIKPRTSAI